MQTLSTAPRIGLLGDTHGNLGHLLTVADTMQRAQVSVLVVLGDFGFLWPGGNWGSTLEKLSKRLAAHGQMLYFVDGNHEWFPRLYSFPVGDDGLRWLRPNIAHLPRGYRTSLLSGRSLAVLGGANSIDYAFRAVGSSWWAEETITDGDLDALGHEPCDVLLGHDAPQNVPALDAFLAKTAHHWSAEALRYADAGRQKFHQGFLQTRPRLYAGGHYHLHVDQRVRYESAGWFETRVVILDRDGSDTTISQAVLDVDTIDLTFLTRDGTPIG